MIPFGAPAICPCDTAEQMLANARHCRELYLHETDPEHRSRLAACISAYRSAAQRLAANATAAADATAGAPSMSVGGQHPTI